MMPSEILSFEDIKKEPYVIENILWDVQPKDMMEPLSADSHGFLKRDRFKGYLFYIDTMDKKPGLFLMRHTAADFAETLARVDNIPTELLMEAMQENTDKAYFKMYPINKKVEAWLKEELGIRQ